MYLISTILIALVALEHLYFLWLEMFAWESAGKRAFGRGRDDRFFAETKAMAANQGLYNGFLAAGLIWSFFIDDADWAKNVAMFFLGCVVVAGVYGGATVGKRIIYIQALPAMLALIAVWLR